MYSAEFIEKLERELQLNPSRYHAKVTLLAVLGNVYIAFGMLSLFALLILSCLSVLVLKALAIKLIAIAGVFLFVVARSLWVKMEPPSGIEISAVDAPELFKIIENLSLQLGAAKFNHVLITDDFNAAVVQCPRLGILGWYENYLIIGLPLMQSLKVEQLTAVLAHEFGHLSKNHARNANWIYRQRIRWAQLFTEIEQKVSHADFIFRPFLKRFVPYFAAYSFPIARANEYEADRISAILTSLETVAETLSTVNVIGLYWSERYWPDILNQAQTLPHPHVQPYAGYLNHFSAGINGENTHLLLNHSLKMSTDFADTHPSLSDRLQSIGQTARVEYPVPGQTADYLLGQKRLEIAAEFDRNWQKAVQYDWQKHYQLFQEQRAYLAELAAKAPETLSLAERLNYIELTESVAHQPEQAYRLAEALYSEYPDEPRVMFVYAKALIARKDERAAALLNQAMDADEFLIIPCCELLIQHYDHVQAHEKSAHFRQLLEQRAVLEMKAVEERESISSKDDLIPHGLAQKELEALAAQLEKYSSIQKVWLVRKRIMHLPESPCYVLGFSIKQGLFDKVSENLAVQTINSIKAQTVFPGEAFLLCVDLTECKPLFKKMKKIPQSCILQR